MLYHYELLNNHYVVDINGKKYLIDTGSHRSFPLNSNARKVAINGKEYPLQTTPPMNIEKTTKLIGITPDGLIGTDILAKTSLTIYKNGTLEFKANKIDGRELDIQSVYPLIVEGSSCGYNGSFIVDTGAKYGYGLHKVFKNKRPYEYVWDYNPGLGDLSSNIYHLEVSLGGETYPLDVCDNIKVEIGYLAPCASFMVGNITTFFKEVVVFDFVRKKLILR